MKRMRASDVLRLVAYPMILGAGYATFRAYASSGAVSTLYYRYALYTFLGVVILMESRVLLGTRGKRDAIFYIHLAAGACVLSLLTLVGFFYTSSLLEVEVLLFSTVSVATGLFLLHRKG